MALNITNTVEFIRARIRAENPDIDLRDFLAIFDLLIKMGEVLLQPMIDTILEVQANQSLIDVDALTDAAVDALLANLLVSRRQGGFSSGVVRNYFDEPLSTTFLEGTVYLSDDGDRFLSTTTIAISKFTMQANVEGDLFFVDVPVQSESAGDFNVDVDGIVDIQGGPAGVVRVTNKAKFSGGAPRDDKVTAVALAKAAISVRDLVVDNSITTVLLQNFPSIRSLSVVGYGDDEMERDVLVGDNLSIGGETFGSANGTHIGGKVEPYLLGSGLEEKEEDVLSIKEFVRLRPEDEFDPDPTPLNVQYADGVARPVVQIVKIEELDPGTGEPTGVTWERGTDYEYKVEETSVAFSTLERPFIQVINPAKLGLDVRFTYETSSLVQQVQTFMDDPLNRVVTADILAKHAVPAKVAITISYRLPAGSDVSEDDVEAALKAFIQGLATGATFEVSDVVNVLYETGAEFVDLSTLVVAVTVFDEEGKETLTLVTNTFNPNKNVGYLVGDITATELTA